MLRCVNTYRDTANLRMSYSLQWADLYQWHDPPMVEKGLRRHKVQRWGKRKHVKFSGHQKDWKTVEFWVSCTIVLDLLIASYYSHLATESQPATCRLNKYLKLEHGSTMSSRERESRTSWVPFTYNTDSASAMPTQKSRTTSPVIACLTCSHYARSCKYFQ